MTFVIYKLYKQDTDSTGELRRDYRRWLPWGAHRRSGYDGRIWEPHLGRDARAH
jgi:hypothetical protein